GRHRSVMPHFPRFAKRVARWPSPEFCHPRRTLASTVSLDDRLMPRLNCNPRTPIKVLDNALWLRNNQYAITVGHRTRAMAGRKTLALTDRQFEVLGLLWEHGPLTV